MTQQSTKTPFGDDPNYITHAVCLDMSNEERRYRWIKDHPKASFADYRSHFGCVFWGDLRTDDPDVDTDHVEAHMHMIRTEG